MKAAVLAGLVLAFAGGAGVVHALEPVPAEPQAVEKTATACTYRDEPVPTNAPIEKSTLTLLGRDPAESGEVHRDTPIALDLEYRIKDLGAGAVYIIPFFKTAGDGSTTPGDPSTYPALAAAAGRAHLCVPLAEMYAVPMLDWPITVVLNLMQTLPNGSMMIIASLRPMKFNAADTPEGALARQAERPPIEYYDALKTVWNFFETRLARYKACNQRFPEGQPALTVAYRRWESRHTAALQLASELQFDFYLMSMNGHTPEATMMFDGARESMLNSYAQWPVENLRRECARILSEFSDTEDLSDNVFTDEIAYLRKWQATHAKGKAP